MNYVVQELYDDGTIHNEWWLEECADACASASAAVNSPMFEADYARVLSADGELEWTVRP